MTKENARLRAVPGQVLAETLWCFTGAAFAGRPEFDAAVRRYQLAVRKRDDWQPDQRVIDSSRISVTYLRWEDGDQVDDVIELSADDAAAFTAGELLFKLHNAIVEALRDSDHKFFEGLWLSKEKGLGGRPRYSVRLGS